MPTFTEQPCGCCGTPFVPKYASQRFCSRTCWGKSIRTVTEAACRECGKTFLPKCKRDRSYCSRKCLHSAQSKLYARPVTLMCKQCGAGFTTKPCHVRSGTKQFCSVDCYTAAQTVKVSAACSVCGKEFSRIPSRTGEFCSHRCRGIASRRRVTLTCATCGKSYEQLPSRTDSRFCSRKCKVVGWAATVAKIVEERGETIPERLMRNALESLGVSFLPQYVLGPYVLDFFLPVQNLAIEVDGVYWHSLPGMQAKDAMKDGYIRKHRMRVIHISDLDVVHSKDLASLVTSWL